MWLRTSLVLPTVLFGLQILSHHKVLAEGERCNNALNNGRGVCVNMKQCDQYIAILKQYGTAAGELLRNTVCNYKGSDPIVCCPNTNRPDTVGKNNNNNYNDNYQKGDAKNNNKITEPTPNKKKPPPQPESTAYPPLLEPQCGFSDAKHGRVVGGIEAEKGAWPWVAALGYKNTKEPGKIKWLCGGSLISARHILTAGHCVHNRYDLYLARLGDHDLQSDNDGVKPIDIGIQRGVIHPDYSSTNYVNDIAVLRLKSEVQFSRAIHPICLPIPPEIKNRDYVQNYPFLAGWGSLYFHGPSSATLQEVQLPVVSNEDCKRVFAPFPTQVIDERVMCAGYTQGGKDACQGDSGGALMFPKGYHYYAIGIVSFGFRCAEPGFPGVYTKVTHFMDFITSNMV